jgi:DNA-binding response OmpR family regulator
MLTEQPDLSGARILVAEDEAVIGLALEAMLADAGATVIGPVASVAAAVALADGARPTAAILDFRLRDGCSEPLARWLAAARVPFLFYTGHLDHAAIRAAWPDSPVLAKPATPRALLATVAWMLAERRPAQRMTAR